MRLGPSRRAVQWPIGRVAWDGIVRRGPRLAAFQCAGQGVPGPGNGRRSGPQDGAGWSKTEADETENAMLASGEAENVLEGEGAIGSARHAHLRMGRRLAGQRPTRQGRRRRGRSEPAAKGRSDQQQRQLRPRPQDRGRWHRHACRHRSHAQRNSGAAGFGTGSSRHQRTSPQRATPAE